MKRSKRANHINQMKQQIKDFAITLDTAVKATVPVPQLSGTSKIDLNDAYAIQAASMEQRYARGEKLVGLKMGFTSKAKMEQMGVHDMIWGRLTDSMEIEANGDMQSNLFIHPRAEPELAFRLKKDIHTPITLSEIDAVLEGIAPAIEIIDSRYANFKFSLEDVIADNCSSSGFVVGKWHAPNTNVLDLPITIGTNGTVQQSGSSKAILGNPLQSLVEATRLALKYGQELKKGMIILAGAATPAIHVHAGETVSASFGGLGEIKFKVV